MESKSPKYNAVFSRFSHYQNLTIVKFKQKINPHYFNAETLEFVCL